MYVTSSDKNNGNKELSYINLKAKHMIFRLYMYLKYLKTFDYLKSYI